MSNFPEEAVSLGHEAPAPDRHWLDEAVMMPEVPLADQLRDRLSPAGLATAYTVARFCLRMVDGCKSQPIPEGVELPIRANQYNAYNGILKVIRDFRTLHREFSPLANWRNIGDEDEFNERTRAMRKDKIYLGGPAKLKVMSDDETREASLVRTVAYYQAAPSGRQLGGIPSHHISKAEFLPVFTTAFLPPLRVGTAYRSGDSGTSRIISAEVLHLTDKQNPKARAGRSSKRLTASLGLLPKSVPGTN